MSKAINLRGLAALSTSVLLVACGGGSGGSSSQSNGNASSGPISQPATSSFTGKPLDCTNFNKLQAGDYIATTNPNGVTGPDPQYTFNGTLITSSFVYTDCVGISQIGSGVEYDSKWSLPTQIRNAIYPSIIYGLKGGFTGANTQLPKSIASTNSLNVAWNYELSNAGAIGDVLLETWLTNTPTPSGLAPYQGTMVELGINLELYGGWAIKTGLPVVTVGGNQYYLDAGNGPGAPSDKYGTIQSGNSPYQYRAFFTPVNSVGRNASLDLKLFAQFLIDNNYIPANTLYFSDVEIGTEVAYGTGEFKVNRFNVNVQ